MALNITKGEWLRDRASGFECDVRSVCGRKVCAVNVQDMSKGKPHSEQRKIENEANANLIAEAGTVANECGLTPRQLLEQRDELFEALVLAELALSGFNMDMSIIERKIKSALLKARNASDE